MPNNQVELSGPDEAKEYILKLDRSAETTRNKLQKIIEEQDSMEFLRKVRFEKIGCDPLEEGRDLNFVEQINQTFTYLASFKASEILFKEYPGLNRLNLNLGTASGTDIESTEFGGIAAEVFSAVSIKSSDKLSEDRKKVSKTPAKNKYVFYMSPQSLPQSNPYCKEGVTIWAIK